MDENRKLLEPIQAEIKEIESKSTEPIRQLNDLKDKRSRLEGVLWMNKDYDRLVYEIEQMKEKLGFGIMSAKEESDLQAKKNKLEALLPTSKLHREVKAKLTKLHSENQVHFDRLKVLRAQKKKLTDSNNDIWKKREALKVAKTESTPLITQLEL